MSSTANSTVATMSNPLMPASAVTLSCVEPIEFVERAPPVQHPVPDVGDDDRREHDGIEEHRPPEAAPHDVLVHDKRGRQRHDAHERHLHDHEPERVAHRGPEVEPLVRAGARVEDGLAGEDAGVVLEPHPGPVEERDGRPPRHRDVEVQHHRREGEEPEDQHVGQEKRVRHACPPPDRLREFHREAQEVHEELRHLPQRVAPPRQQPDRAAHAPEEAGQRQHPSAECHASARVAGRQRRPPVRMRSRLRGGPAVVRQTSVVGVRVDLLGDLRHRLVKRQFPVHRGREVLHRRGEDDRVLRAALQEDRPAASAAAPPRPSARRG